MATFNTCLTFRPIQLLISNGMAIYQLIFRVMCSVTKLGNMLYFGQLFKACGNNYFAQTSHILVNFCTVVKIFHFSSEIIFGQLL